MKYKFVVEYQDGSIFKQTKEDISEIDPKRNCYYDVLHSKKKIKRFSLKRLFNNWTVDLTTGIFYHNGIKIQVEENPMVADRELIYFMQHQRDFKLGSREETGHRVTYFLGWKKGKTERVIGFK